MRQCHEVVYWSTRHQGSGHGSALWQNALAWPVKEWFSTPQAMILPTQLLQKCFSYRRAQIPPIACGLSLCQIPVHPSKTDLFSHQTEEQASGQGIKGASHAEQQLGSFFQIPKIWDEMKPSHYTENCQPKVTPHAPAHSLWSVHQTSCATLS